ncbi:hypothetical protein [Streptacidiphilus carbonis]|nr:hypothetical protein [Streptacidiphilus carbonis]
MAPNGKCPSCGQRIGSKPGQPTTPHSLPDNPNKACKGGTTLPL